MITRLSRKARPYSELGIKSQGGLADLLDNAFKETFRLTDEEYDWVAERASDEEIDLLADELRTFALKRKLLAALQKHMTEFYA